MFEECQNKKMATPCDSSLNSAELSRRFWSAGQSWIKLCTVLACTCKPWGLLLRLSQTQLLWCLCLSLISPSPFTYFSCFGRLLGFGVLMGEGFFLLSRWVYAWWRGFVQFWFRFGGRGFLFACLFFLKSINFTLSQNGLGWKGP